MLYENMSMVAHRHYNNICFIRLLRPYILSFVLVLKLDHDESMHLSPISSAVNSFDYVQQHTFNSIWILPCMFGKTSNVSQSLYRLSIILGKFQERQKSKKLEDLMTLLDTEIKRTDSLLYQMIPPEVADILRKGSDCATTTCQVPCYTQCPSCFYGASLIQYRHSNSVTINLCTCGARNVIVISSIISDDVHIYIFNALFFLVSCDIMAFSSR